MNIYNKGKVSAKIKEKDFKFHNFDKFFLSSFPPYKDTHGILKFSQG